jgi:hypothetical protein
LGGTEHGEHRSRSRDEVTEVGGELNALGDSGSDARAAADRAHHAAERAREHARAVRARATIRADHLCDEVRRADVVTAAAVDRAAALAPLGGRRHSSAPSPARAFGATVFSGLSKSDWQQLAYFLAGIQHWDPDEGVLANDANIRAVYAFYGRMWSNDHDLQWAGMANLVGPLFYAGWQDLYVLRTLADGGDRTEYLTRMLGLPRLPGFAYSAADLAQALLGGSLADLSGEELEWFERRFLNMQKQIFDDRWRWIEGDMLPHYQDLLRDPDAMQELVDRSVSDRAGDWRKVPLPYPGG